jgi:hypothetical protein
MINMLAGLTPQQPKTQMYSKPNQQAGAQPYMQPVKQPPRLQGNASNQQRIDRLQGLQAQGQLGQGRANRLNMLQNQQQMQNQYSNAQPMQQYQTRPMLPQGQLGQATQTLPPIGRGQMANQAFGMMGQQKVSLNPQQQQIMTNEPQMMPMQGDQNGY